MPSDTAVLTAHRHAGFTIIELLVALAVLSIAMATIMSAMLANTNLNNRVEKQANAMRVAEQVMESYRQRSDYGTLRAPLSQNVTMNGRTYTAITTFCPTDLPSATLSSMPCNNTSVYIRVEIKDGITALQKVESYFTQFGSGS